MKRTTIRLSEDLIAEIKAASARRGKTMTAVIEDAIRVTVVRPGRSPKRRLDPLPTFKGRGLQAGVDLDNNAALLDLMDGWDAADRRQRARVRLPRRRS